MKNLAFVCFITFAIFCGKFDASAQDFQKVYKTNWLKSEARKAGLVTSFSIAQALSGAVDAYGFRQSNTYIIGENNYHVFRAAREIAWVGTGWFSYAEIQARDLRWWQKGAHFVGAGLLARNAFEWSYKTCRYGNPFDYTKEHNKHALVYIKFEGGLPKDAYIGLGPLSGPAVDLTCVALGVWLLGR